MHALLQALLVQCNLGQKIIICNWESKIQIRKLFFIHSVFWTKRESTCQSGGSFVLTDAWILHLLQLSNSSHQHFSRGDSALHSERPSARSAALSWISICSCPVEGFVFRSEARLLSWVWHRASTPAGRNTSTESGGFIASAQPIRLTVNQFKAAWTLHCTQRWNILQQQKVVTCRSFFLFPWFMVRFRSEHFQHLFFTFHCKHTCPFSPEQKLNRVKRYQCEQLLVMK